MGLRWMDDPRKTNIFVGVIHRESERMRYCTDDDKYC